MKSPIIYWYRQDLRAYDLPGLTAALATGHPIIACYILDEESPGEWTPGAASRWWLQHSLAALSSEISKLGGQLVLRRGDALSALRELVRQTGAQTIYCTRQYEPWAAALEHSLHEALGAQEVVFRRYAGALLFEPGQVMNKSGQPFKVFTPFWRNCRALPEPGTAKALPGLQNWWANPLASDRLSDWSLCPTQPDWASHWLSLWQPGTEGARKKLQLFLNDGLGNYEEGRDQPSLECTSRLSAHLHLGEISPRELWHAARDRAASDPSVADQVDKFLSELGWREFSHHLLYHFPHIATQPFKQQFSEFPWMGTPAALAAWQEGQTGYPIVDAGMRELWQTGFMHNRVRMIVASFLTKHLLVHWRAGADWFWDTLLDADLANNSSGWQWVAGSGADASPYFRIFNPITQGAKFDSQGLYIRRWVPELADVPDTYLNCPWDAPEQVLADAGVVLGEDYPQPIVDHRAAREAALAAYASLRK